MERAEFETLVAEALDGIPEEFARYLENVSVVVEDEPDDEGLYGLYQGVPLSERSHDFAALEGYMAQMDHYMKDDDLPGMRAPHLAFHNLIVSGAGPRVSQEIEQLFDHAERYRLQYGKEGRWTDRRAEHRAILDAVAAGDEDLAALRLAEHYARTASLVFAGMDPEHDLEGRQLIDEGASVIDPRRVEINVEAGQEGCGGEKPINHARSNLW